MSGTLWTAAAIAEAVAGRASADFAVGGVAFDSREVGPGDLFIALKGEQADGHDYVPKALANGAAGVLVSSAGDYPHILVEDTAAALNALGTAARTRSDATIIGVTGSAGKTGTKEALFAALDRASHGSAHRSVKSYNNHVGVPLSLARMPADSAYGVFEMGMNHAGELSALTQLVRPDIAIITTIAPAHIGNFGSIEAIADAKAEIFAGLTSGGTAILPFDSPYYDRLRAHAAQKAEHLVSFGLGEGADVRVLDQLPDGSGGVQITAKVHDRQLHFAMAQAGEHLLANAMAVLAAVYAARADLAVAGLALAEMGGLAGRGARHQIASKDGGTALLIDESYNANPLSMRATLRQFAQQPVTGKRRAVLGAMGELGEHSAHYHAQLADDILAAQIDQLVLVGDDMRYCAEKLASSSEIHHAPDWSQALAIMSQNLHDGDAILIKGSNYLGLAKLVEALVRGEA